MLRVKHPIRSASPRGGAHAVGLCPIQISPYTMITNSVAVMKIITSAEKGSMPACCYSAATVTGASLESQQHLFQGLGWPHVTKVGQFSGQSLLKVDVAHRCPDKSS